MKQKQRNKKNKERYKKGNQRKAKTKEKKEGRKNLTRETEKDKVKKGRNKD